MYILPRKTLVATSQRVEVGADRALAFINAIAGENMLLEA
jgi:hypothetical protein